VIFRDEKPGDAAGQPHHLERKSTIQVKDPRVWRSLIKEFGVISQVSLS
jgi:hypothetical protein